MPAKILTSSRFEYSDVKTYVMCIKQASNGSTPLSSYLAAGTGKSVRVYGQWLRHHCKYGIIDVFKINKTAYDDVNGQCKAKGYDHAQPSDDAHLSSYPFQTDDQISEYYRHKTPFTFEHIEAISVSECFHEEGRGANKGKPGAGGVSGAPTGGVGGAGGSRVAESMGGGAGGNGSQGASPGSAGVISGGSGSFGNISEGESGSSGSNFTTGGLGGEIGPSNGTAGSENGTPGGNGTTAGERLITFTVWLTMVAKFL